MTAIIKWLMAIALLTITTADAQTETPRVRMETSKGAIVIALDPQAAPKTVANFLAYVESGFYDNTIFHRVIKGFMIQGGGFEADMRQKRTQAAIVNEADNRLKNLAGTIAMARTSAPHSATSQFFINTVDNAFLDFKRKTNREYGYCVFGRVVEGMEVVKAIENVATAMRGGHRDVPVEPVIIQKTALVTQQLQPSQPEEPTQKKE